MGFNNTIPFFTEFFYAGIIGFASFINGAIGIGFPLIATPLLAIIIDVRSAILILVIPTTVINVANIIIGGRWQKNIARYWPLAAYGIIGSLIGTQILIVISPELFRPLLAGMLIFYLNAARLGLGFSWIHKYPRLAVAVFGLSAGIMGGIVNVMVPVLIIYALEMRMPKNAMIQVFNFCFLFGKLTQGAVLAQSGFMTRDIIKVSVPLAILGLIVMYLGTGIRDRIKTETYHRCLRYLLLLIVFVLLFQFFQR
jgi:uncharacterized membrane protein YfcA